MLTKDSIDLSRKRHKFADEALLATTTVALMVSLAVAVTVVSIGIARADTLGPELFSSSTEPMTGQNRR